MAAQFKEWAVDDTGETIPGAEITVRDSEGNLATIYSDDGVTEILQPFNAEADGSYSFFAETGEYVISVGTSPTQSDAPATIIDLRTPYQALRTRSAFVAAVALGIPVLNGVIVNIDGFAYKAKSGAAAIPDLPGWVPAGSLYVNHFGAVGDRVADDTAAFQAAISYVESSGEGVKPTINLSDGIFLVTDRLVFKEEFIRLKGRGVGRARGDVTKPEGASSILYDGPDLDSTTGVIDATNSVGIQIDDLSILCQFKANGIVLNACPMAEIRRVYIDQPLRGVVADTCYSSQIARAEIFDPRIGGIDLLENCHAFSIKSCRFNNQYGGLGPTDETPEFGIQVASVGNCSIVSIEETNVDLYNVTRQISVINECRGFALNNVYAECRGDGVTGAAVVIENGDGISITGGRYTKSDNPTPTPISYGINLGVGVDGASITGVFFQGWDSHCIRQANGARNVTTSGCDTNGVPLLDDQNDIRRSVSTEDGHVRMATFSLGSATTYLISGGEVAIDSSVGVISLDTEGAAPTDELSTISGSFLPFQFLLVQTLTSGRDVTVKDGTGNIQLDGDKTLSSARGKLWLVWNDLTEQWQQVAFSDS